MAARSKLGLSLLREILRELRLSSPTKGPTRQVFGYTYLLSECRRTRGVNQEKAVAIHRDANNYLCLLRSERVRQELHQQYKGRGERSVEEVARLVGFELPKQHQRTNNYK